MPATRPLYQPVWRSLLYVPVTSERFVEKAHTRGADAIILDLEDAVAPSEKERARKLVSPAAQSAGQGGADVLVRINRPWRQALLDVEAAVGPFVRGLVLPKLDSPEQVHVIAEMVSELEQERELPLGSTVFFPRIETPAGLQRAPAIADADPRVVALGLGSTDFSIATEAEPGGIGNQMASFLIVVAARAAGRVPLGLVAAITDFGDLDAFRLSVEASRALGLRGAPCVHPSQVGVLNTVFGPSDQEFENADRIVSEFTHVLSTGAGAAMIDGEFVDLAHYEQARRLLAARESLAQNDD